MKVEPEGSLRKASLKRCLWMDKKGRTSEGKQNEADRRIALHQQRCLTTGGHISRVSGANC